MEPIKVDIGQIMQVMVDELKRQLGEYEAITRLSSIDFDLGTRGYIQEWLNDMNLDYDEWEGE